MRHAWPWLSVAGLLLTIPLLHAAAAAADSDDENLLKAANVGVDGPGLLDYFRRRTTTPAQKDHIAALIRQLGDDSFRARQKAVAELAALGPTAVPFLRRALGDPDQELKERAENLIRSADGLDAVAARSAAAARLVRRRAPADAAGVLLAFAPDSENDEVEEEVVAALAVTAVRDGQVDAPVVAALKDQDPARRGAAAAVVGRSGAAAQQADVRGLLTDPDPRVRFRAAQGLLAGRDRAGVPALAALVKDGPTDLAYRSHELLSVAVGGPPSRTPFGDDAATRQACARGWDALAKMRLNLVGYRRSSDLPAFNPALRARDVARQFFNALVTGDLNALKKASDLPFYAQDNKPVLTADDFTNYFNSNPMGLRGGQFTPVLLGSASLQTYFKGPVPTEFLTRTGLKSPDLAVVVVQQNQAGVPYTPPAPGQAFQANLFLVRLAGEQPRVIGVNPAQPRSTSGWDW